MAKIIFILGGGRSGKSRFAVHLAKKYGGKVSFIATCLALDKEMKERIMLHKKSRPPHWETFEEPMDVSSVLKQIGAQSQEASQTHSRPLGDVIIIDCLTLLVSNLLLKGHSESDIENEVGKILAVLSKIKGRAIIVSNEVGLGIVPANKLSRDFRDIAGKINQFVAENSDEVIFMVSGLPLKIKNGNTQRF